MDTEAVLDREFRDVMSAFAQSRAMVMLAEGGVRLPHYNAVLREIYHYSKEDPQIQALAAVYFRGKDRGTVKMFLKHATSEVGHDQMALADLQALGEDVSTIANTLPLPATIALTAFPFYQIQYHNPIGYLGYLYFLEYMPTKAGKAYMGALSAAGVPEKAMTFLQEHVTVDVAHNKLMEEYTRRLVRTDADLAAVVYAMKVTGYLYGQMLAGAIESVDRSWQASPNFVELSRSSTSRASVSSEAA